MGSTDVVYALIALLAIALVVLLSGRRRDAEPEQKEPISEPERAGDTKAQEPTGREGRQERAPAEERPEREAAPTSRDLPKVPEKGPGPKAPESARDTEVAGGDRAPAPDIEGLRRGLAKSRAPEGFFGRLKALLGGQKEISPALAEDIEEVLLASDVGVQATEAILGRIRETLTKGELLDSTRVWQALRDESRRILEGAGTRPALESHPQPTVVLLVGVNGSGKTTTIGKLATRLTGNGHACVLAAGDTFRAAAVQQLVVWGERAGCEVVRGKDGGDPASVVFDAIRRAKENGASFVLADTAGRLHTQTNLVQEMQKVVRSASKAMEGAPHELLLVIDATNGQNALAQAKQFREALPLTGIVLTKLDGTAKGGVVLGISDALRLPVRYIGLGERADDLRDFAVDEFLEALLGKDSEVNAA